MADTKITALTALTAADPANDVIPIVDVSDTTMAASGTTKKISVNNILSSSPTATGAFTVSGLVTAGSATITGDLTVDTTTLVVDATNDRVGIGTTTPACKLEVVAPAGDNIVSTFRSGDATAANNAGGGFRSISSATAASRIAQIWLDADGANFSGGDYFFIQKNGSSGTVEFNQFSNAAMTFLTNNTERARFNNTGAFVLAGGTTTAGGIGIAFPAVQVPSSDAKTLDDYEEGAWAPTVSGEVNLTSTTLVSARYTKIGRVVTISGSVTTFIITSNTLAYFALGNLPFNCSTIVPGPLYNDTRNTSGNTQVTGTLLYGLLPAASGTTSGSAMTLYFSNTYTV